jgi:hypothetical protein
LGLARPTQQREVQEEELGRPAPAEQDRGLPVPVERALEHRVREVEVLRRAVQGERGRLVREVAPEVRGTTATVVVMGTAMVADMVMDMVREQVS